MDVNVAEAKNTSIQSDTKFVSGVDSNTNSRRSSGIPETKANAAPISVSETKEVVKSLESYMNALQTSIAFQVNKDTDQVVVTITNRETNEVIRQIPPEELISLQERMKELTGIIFSETV